MCLIVTFAATMETTNTRDVLANVNAHTSACVYGSYGNCIVGVFTYVMETIGHQLPVTFLCIIRVTLG